jgi:hypothetical protein
MNPVRAFYQKHFEPTTAHELRALLKDSQPPLSMDALLSGIGLFNPQQKLPAYLKGFVAPHPASLDKWYQIGKLLFVVGATFLAPILLLAFAAETLYFAVLGCKRLWTALKLMLKDGLTDPAKQELKQGALLLIMSIVVGVSQCCEIVANLIKFTTRSIATLRAPKDKDDPDTFIIRPGSRI